MIVKFWGVRGSFTTAHPSVMRYGGNTSCVSVEMGGKLLVIDAGSGVRILGDSIDESMAEIYFVLTHLHRDHHEGFPFFAPLYEKGQRIHLLEYQNGSRHWSLLSMLNGVNFPMSPQSVEADHDIVTIDGMNYLREQGFHISKLQVNHPGGAYGYRLEEAGASLVHIPDNELDPPNPVTSYDEVVAFCEGASVLSHDAMYIEKDLPEKKGWGHSTISEVCNLAIAARVKHLVLFHHDPYRTDEEIDHIQGRARALLEPHGIECTAAFEGLEFHF